MKINLSRLILGFLFSIFHASVFFYLASDEALTEDPTSYYLKYSISNISLEDFFDLIVFLIEGNSDATVQLSFSYVNVFAHIYFGALGSLPFKIFVFVNMLAISALAIFTLSRIPRVGIIESSLMLTSLPMVVYMHFTWRQALAQLLVLLLISLNARALKPLSLAISVAVHPLAVAALSESRLWSTERVRLRRAIVLIIFGGIGYFISSFSTIGTVLNSVSDQSDWRLYLWLLIFFLYALPLILRCNRSALYHTSLIVFLALLIGYLLNSTEIVGVSRLVAFGALSMLFFGLSTKPSSIVNFYYATLGPCSLLAYLISQNI